ncbi:carbohydrate porin [Alteromonas ponticola]|uniref:Carbohydrate porin n=1 Tax=Alteromonas ponticola TaxID=2720613 RepID=A0ABX1R1W0_9ALTE|nr:carbohydrate porin [Alteromonas ponticola]NMH59233.1 carbohydrate porin [Alteromonas ponticola]
MNITAKLCTLLLPLYLGAATTPLHAQVAHSFNANGIVDVSVFNVDGVDKNSVSRGLVEAGYAVSSDNLAGYVSAMALRGDNASTYIGDVQAFSNIDENEFEGIYEAWGHYRFTDTFSIKAGRVDLNNDFAFATNALEFLNGAMGLSPTVFALPTYPEPATSVIVDMTLNPNHSIKAAAAAGAGRSSFADRFYIAEWHYRADTLSVKLGGWEHNGEFFSLTDEIPRQGTGGAYAIVEGKLGQPDWHYYVQLGVSDTIVAEIDRHVGVGVTVNNLAGNESLMAGIAYTVVRLSNVVPASHSSEKALELFFKSQLREWVSVKPNLQYIANPSGESRNHFVGTLRVEMSY